MSIMEFSNAHGTIVCMPTGGASGIVPAAVYRIGDQMGKTETEQENALLVAGLIGAFYYPTHYTGAIGCQAEIGVAVSMASAALCSMMTDDPDTIHCAASLGGQVLMGLLCNPIEGYAGPLHRAEYGRRANRRHLCQCGAGGDGSHRAAGRRGGSDAGGG